jgi:hypothetical protein
MSKKTCSRCLQLKDLLDFSPDKRAKDARQSSCKACNLLRQKSSYYTNIDQSRAKGRARYKKNPNRVINQNLIRNYGITLEQKMKMINVQGNKCLICKVEFGHSKKENYPCTDHNHSTGRVRGILCPPCNKALGNVRENFGIALDIAKYIQEDQGVI